MKNATDKFKAFIGKLAPSSSSLVVGVKENTAIEMLAAAAQMLSVKPIDICLLNTDSRTGKQDHIYIEATKKWLHDINISPQGKLKIGAIPRADKLNEQSANALLKTLEEPPESVIILLFSDSDNLLSTIKSRCKIIHLHNREIKTSHDLDESILNKPFYEQSKAIEKIVKNNEVAQFIDDLERIAESRLRNNPQSTHSLFLKNLFETKKRIKQNANARLQLENLLLSYKGKN